MQDNELIKDLFLPEYMERGISGIPWAYKNPSEEFTRWSFLTQNYFSFEQSNSRALQNKLNANEFASPTKEKIQNLIKTKNSHIKSLKKVLDPFLKETQKVTINSQQNILAYQDLLFRDWSWGKKENDVYLDYILKNLDGTEQNILVLGAGACGLSHSLSLQSSANIIATDINPYLMLSAQKLFNGKTLKLGEFNDFPSSIEDFSYTHEFEKVQSSHNHFQVFCDFNDLPFVKESFDVVISPWFYDIIDMDLGQSLQITNRLLKPEGKNLFIGPSNFHKSKISKRKTTEEIIKSFEENYSTVNFEKKFCPYLDNPNSSQKRIEEILFICSQDKVLCEITKNSISQSIDLTPDLVAYRQKVDVFSRILKHVENQQSFEDLASKLQIEFDFSKDEALYYAKSFMQKILAEI
jgi:SAM-dependent methyltransferase